MRFMLMKRMLKTRHRESWPGQSSDPPARLPDAGALCLPAVLLSGCHDLDNFLQTCMRDADFL